MMRPRHSPDGICPVCAVPCPVCGEVAHSHCGSPRRVLPTGHHPARVLASAKALRRQTTTLEPTSSQTNDDEKESTMTSKTVTRTVNLLALKKEALDSQKAYEAALKAEIGTKLEYLATVARSVAWKMNALRDYMTKNEDVPLGDLMWIRSRLEVKSVTASDFTVLCHPKDRPAPAVEKTFPWSILSLSDRDMASLVRKTVRSERAKTYREEVAEATEKEAEVIRLAEEARKQKGQAQTALRRLQIFEDAKKEKRKKAEDASEKKEPTR